MYNQLIDVIRGIFRNAMMEQDGNIAIDREPFVTGIFPTNTATSSSYLTQNNQILPPCKFVTHHSRSGINPLVDSAGYLFSLIGKLKQTTSQRNLAQLQQELLQEINLFQEAAKSRGYSAELVLVSSYALCAVLDDTIANTTWGNQGHWQESNLLTAFNPESAHQDRFFVILERISKDPVTYIDVMELMYICLSLGFKGSYRTTDYSHNQLEQITNALYKQIRTHQGDFSKTLSPFYLRPAQITKKEIKKPSAWSMPWIVSGIVLLLFTGLSYMLDNISHKTYEELTHIGKSVPYEAHS